MSMPPSSPPPPPPSSPPPSSPPPQGPPADAAVVVTLQGSAMTSSMVTPTVRLNGHPVPARYGDNSYPLPAGRWHVDVSAQWLRTYGQAAADVDLAPGQVVRLYYAAPMHQFSRGAMGPEPQKRPGLGAMLAIIAVVVVVVVVVAVLPALLG